MGSLSELILFLHIPKTAGSTVQRFFEIQFDADQVFPLNWQDPSQTQQYDDLSGTAKNRLRAVTGHMRFGLHRYINRPSTYVTLLRHPIDRLVSFYYFALACPDMYMHQAASGMTLAEFVASGVSIELDNLQVRMLAGRMRAPIGTLTGADLKLAEENLRSHFAVVGVQDDVDGFIDAVSDRFDLPRLHVPSQNITERRPALSAVSPVVKDAIRKRNSLDMELYQYVKDTMASQSRWQRSVRVVKELAMASLYVVPALWPDALRMSIPSWVRST